MTRARRTVYLVFHLHDGTFLDIGGLLRGVARATPLRRIFALSILTGEEHPITAAELDFLHSIPSDRWTEIGRDDEAVAHDLALKGVLLVDDGDDLSAELVRRDEVLSSTQWNLYAALYHFMTKWRGVDFRSGLDDKEGELPPLTEAEIAEFVGRRGPAPDAFHSLADPGAVVELPLVRRGDGLFRALTDRKTTRTFDRGTALTSEELALVLHYVFGCHGYAPVVEDLVTIKRTSPSGGGLHPIEVYPLVTNVRGVAPGLYHYSVRDHALELIATLGTDEAYALATEFMCGQTYFGSAHVVFVMTARFYRSFWKYRRHQKAYAALLMDAAHLSQTLYLVCAELRLGAFVTAAINAHDIEDRLGLDGWSEGVLAIAGCGKRAHGRSSFEPEFSSYVPRETPSH